VISSDVLCSVVKAVAGSLDDPSLLHITCLLSPYPLPLHLNTTVDETFTIAGIGCCNILGVITAK